MIPFWQLDDRGAASAPAVVELASGLTLSRAELARRADDAAAQLELPAAGGLVFLFASNDLASLAAYLGCLRAGQPVALFSAQSHQHAALLERYRPERVLAPAAQEGFNGYRAIGAAAGSLRQWRPESPPPAAPSHPALAALLSTSGSTGSPKLVRLSHRNLSANADAIREYLGIRADDRAPTTLPLSYSYGLSVVNSHLAAGATLLLGEFPVVQRETWTALERQGATSFAGVPLTYQMLRRLRFEPRTLPRIRTYTQAGGRLDVDTKRWLLDGVTAAQGRCFVMYGQTEATARISFVPPEELARKLDSIGRAIPGGQLELDPQTGEIIYRGPNVMLGYAEQRADLALGDILGGRLATGDVGRVDEDGCFAVVGRLKRFLKVAGLRVSLDELERHLESALGAATACGGRDEALLVQSEATGDPARISALLLERFGLPPSLVQVRLGTPLARLSTGKIDYAALSHG